MPIELFAVHDPVEFLLDRLRDGSNLPFAYGDPVDRTDRGDLGGCAGEENFVGDVKRFTRNLLLDDLDAEVGRSAIQNRA